MTSALGQLGWEDLRRAVQIYLRHAYPAGESSWPTAIARRLAWDQAAGLAAFLDGPLIERTKSADGSGRPIFALRLGNHRYPHMKIQLEPWRNEPGYLIAVNTHDQIHDLPARDLDEFRALQVENQALKEKIEREWEAAGLPTFTQFLRQYVEPPRTA